MLKFKALVRNNKNSDRPGDCYVSRLYTEGHEDNLAAWEEEVRDDFDEIIRYFGDDPNDCYLRGEVKCVWMTRHRYPKIVVTEPTDGQVWDKATMIRVHRKNTPGASP